MRITANGQVTIPKRIRDELGLLPHTEVAFVLDGEGARLVKVRPQKGEGRGALAVRLLRERGPLAMSTEEIMALTRDA